jgi:hypothetical protein
MKGGVEVLEVLLLLLLRLLEGGKCGNVGVRTLEGLADGDAASVVGGDHG